MISIMDTIRQRFSCRTYLERSISPDKLQELETFINSLQNGPFGSRPRFHLVAANKEDSHILKDLGTYGFIQGASGFIIGVLDSGEKNFEDYGYQMEEIILFATSLGLSTCWLGASFTRSSFAQKINAADDEIIPAVTSLGEIANIDEARSGQARRQMGSDQRLPWEQMFFNRSFNAALSREEAGPYAIPLEMLRIGPSASNKQPWRVIKDGSAWHFYLQRTRNYREEMLARVPGIADIQRLDIGIAMCHFEMTTRELGLSGKWLTTAVDIIKPDDLTEYVVSWVDTLV
jgi:hypothetical protein